MTRVFTSRGKVLFLILCRWSPGSGKEDPWASVLISWMLAQVGRLIIRTGDSSLACRLKVWLDLLSFCCSISTHKCGS